MCSRSSKYNVCIVGLNIGTLYILQQLSKLTNDILIITGKDIENVVHDCIILDIVPQIYIKYGNIEKARLYSRKHMKILMTYDMVQVDDLSRVEVSKNYVKYGDSEYKCDLVICGDEIIKMPDYANLEIIKDIVNNRVQVLISGSDIYKIYELYSILSQFNENIFVDPKVKDCIERELFMHRDIKVKSNSESSDKNIILNIDVITHKPYSINVFRLFRRFDNRVVRDFEIMLRAILYLVYYRDFNLSIDMAVSFEHSVIHVGHYVDYIREKFREYSTCRSCIDYDVGRVCCRFIHFNNMLLSCDIYCSCNDLLHICDGILFSCLSILNNYPIPQVLSIRRFYDGLPAYTPIYAPIMTLVFSKLKKELK